MVRIWGIVVGVHAALLIWMGAAHHRPDILLNKKPVVIRTIQTSAPRLKSAAVSQKGTAAATKPVQKSPAPAKKPVPVPTPVKKGATPAVNEPAKKSPALEPVSKKASTVAVSEPAKKPVAPPPKKKEAPEAIPQQLLDELESSLSKIETKTNKFSGKKSVNMPISGYSLQIDRLDNLDSKETEYQLELVSYLQEALHLPEYGEVKMEITVRPDGSVASLKVLEAESAKNRTYLEKSLPLLRFPTYDKETHTFIFAFCNET